jgi:hypothetical protein
MFVYAKCQSERLSSYSLPVCLSMLCLPQVFCLPQVCQSEHVSAYGLPVYRCLLACHYRAMHKDLSVNVCLSVQLNSNENAYPLAYTTHYTACLSAYVCFVSHKSECLSATQVACLYILAVACLRCLSLTVCLRICFPLCAVSVCLCVLIIMCSFFCWITIWSLPIDILYVYWLEDWLYQLMLEQGDCTLLPNLPRWWNL